MVCEPNARLCASLETNLLAEGVGGKFNSGLGHSITPRIIESVG